MSGANSGGGVRGSRENDIASGAALAERKTEEQAARFAQALLPYVAPQPALAVPPEGWRQSDGALTRQNAEGATQGPVVLAPQSSAGSGEAEGQRVVVSVKTPELGELSLVLDRSGDGVRVVIGVSESEKISQMAGERAALARQLAHSGVNVESIQVVPQAEVGTLLAQQKLAGRLRASGVKEQSAGEAERQRRRGSRKLDFTG